MRAISRRISETHGATRAELHVPWIIGAAILLTGLAAYRIGTTGLIFQELLYFSMLVVTLGLFLVGSIEVTLVAWMSLFVIGIRQLHVTPRFPLHPLVVVITLALALLVLIEGVIRKREIILDLPRTLYIFSGFWIVGLATGLARGTPWDLMLSELVNFLAAYPIFIVTSHTLRQNPAAWKLIIKTLVAVGTTIAVLGLIEYYLPASPLRLLPGFSEGPTTFLAPGGFKRLDFRFFGSPEASLICGLLLPFSLNALMDANRARRKKVALLLVSSLQILAIYLGGYRSMWVITGIVIIALLVLRYRWKGLVISLIVAALVFSLFPESGRARLGLVVAPEVSDNSTIQRSQRALAALETAIVHPLGVGWAGSGWVHSDFAQVAANLGLLAGITFLYWYIKSLIVALKAQMSSQDMLLIGLLGSFLVVGGFLLLQGVEVRSYLMLPVWFTWALLYTRVSAVAMEPYSPSRATS